MIRALFFPHVTGLFLLVFVSIVGAVSDASPSDSANDASQIVEITAPADSAQDPATPNADLIVQGFEKWEWLRSTCVDCEMVLVPKTADLDSPLVRDFLRSIAVNKADLQRLYGIHGAEYNLLAQMAVGILGRESKFFTSTRYKVKEGFPWAIYLAKVVRSYLTGGKVDANSRGPTQIKTIPTKIVNRYGFKPEDLVRPENAAIATMGFLIESLTELKTRSVTSQLTFVTPATYVDYLPYIYFGATKTLVAGKAHPEENLYIREMKKYMEWVDIYERPFQIVPR